MKQIKGKDLAVFRREKLGFVFQDFNLLDTFTVRDNILLPLVLSRTPLAEMERRLKPVVASWHRTAAGTFPGRDFRR